MQGARWDSAAHLSPADSICLRHPFGVYFSPYGGNVMNAILKSPPIANENVGADVYEQMSQLMDLRINSEIDILNAVRSGITPRTYRRVSARLHIPENLVGPETTIRRRLSNNDRLTEAESERFVRVLRLFAQAKSLFQDHDAAMRWFSTPADYVRGQPPMTPMSMAKTDAGTRLIESHMRRTAYGFF